MSLLPEFTYALTNIPDSLTRYYKFQSPASDTFFIMVNLYCWDTATSSRHNTGTATFTSSINDSVYARFSVPVVDTTAATPDSVLIMVAASNPRTKPHLGTRLLVDDLAFIPNTTAIKAVNAKTNDFICYPSPFMDEVTVNINDTKIKEIKTRSSTGKTLLVTKSKTINTSSWSAGLYFIMVEDTEGNTYTQKIIKQ